MFVQIKLEKTTQVRARHHRFSIPNKQTHNESSLRPQSKVRASSVLGELRARNHSNINGSRLSIPGNQTRPEGEFWTEFSPNVSRRRLLAAPFRNSQSQRRSSKEDVEEMSCPPALHSGQVFLASLSLARESQHVQSDNIRRQQSGGGGRHLVILFRISDQSSNGVTPWYFT